MLLSQVITYLVVTMGVVLLFFILKKIYLDSIKVYIDKYLVNNDQESPEEKDLKLYKEKKEKEILKRQLLSQSYSLTKDYTNNTKIVSIIEPIGKWTKLVMNEHFMKLINMKADKKNGFWQVFISMQGMVQGKHRSRGK